MEAAAAFQGKCEHLMGKNSSHATQTERKGSAWHTRAGVNGGHLQHSMGLEATCSDSVRPLGCGMCTRKTSLTRVFFLPMSVSPFRSSMSELRSFRIPAQSMLPKTSPACQPRAWAPAHQVGACTQGGPTTVCTGL